jgi:membrane protein implicated in regulation of membrane protease activity
VLLLTAILLAVFLLPAPWNVLVLAVGVLGEIGEAAFGIWYSRRRRAATGAEGMVGGTAKVVEACRPNGRVSYNGERWQAVCEEGAEIGERVRIKAVDGLALAVERVTEQ